MGRNTAEVEVLTAGLDIHPAFTAWQQIQPTGGPPTSIEVLTPAKSKSAVYRLHGIGPGKRAIIAKRSLRNAIDHEVTLYTDLFPALQLPGLEMYGWLELDGAWWIFLEDAGNLIYEPDNPEHRSLAVDWLGRLHSRSGPSLVRLRDTGPDYFRTVLSDAMTGMRNALMHPGISTSGVGTISAILDTLDVVERAWPKVESACAGLPIVLVHGDFVIKNVRVRERGGRLSLAVLDWETAGAAPPAADLARLPGGEKEQRAYWAIMRHTWPALTLADVHRMRDVGQLFRLLHCVFWEGCSFKHQWIAEAMGRLDVFRRSLETARILRELG